MKQQLVSVISVVVISQVMVSSVNAALVSRLGGLAYYDTEAGLTWLADANYANTSGYDVSFGGQMSWQAANDWATQLTVDGISDWRLPTSDTCSGVDCTSSEIGNLFYNALGNTAGSLTNTGPFSNVQHDWYWSATEYNTDFTWEFFMGEGWQDTGAKSTINAYGWAVTSGDVQLVPVPAAVWLFSTGLLGLIGVARKKARV